MSFEPVDIQVVDAQSNPVADVLIKIYDPTGTTFYTQALTDASGLASLLLETLTYSMRFYRFQTGFTQPQQFTVLEAPETNTFDVVAEPFILPLATDPRLCRCSGFFRDLDGSPKRYLDIHFISQFNPILLGDAAVISSERHARTDENGYLQIDLIRGAMYWARVEDLGSAMPDNNTRTDLRCVSVPDAGSASLPNMLLPIVDRVVLTPAGPHSLAVGAELELTPQVYDSGGVELTGTANADIQWASSDPSVLSVTVTENKLVLRGIAAGSAQVTAERQDLSIIKIPNLPIGGQPIGVTVS